MERLYVVFADLTIATYRWSSMPDTQDFPFTVRAEKAKQLPCHTVSMSSYAIFEQNMAVAAATTAALTTTSPRSIDGGDKRVRQEEPDDDLCTIGSWNFAISGGSGSGGGSSSTSGGDRIICCGFWDHTVKSFGLDGFKQQANTRGGHRGGINCLMIGEDGRTLVTGECWSN